RSGSGACGDDPASTPAPTGAHQDRSGRRLADAGGARFRRPGPIVRPQAAGVRRSRARSRARGEPVDFVQRRPPQCRSARRRARGARSGVVRRRRFGGAQVRAVGMRPAVVARGTRAALLLFLAAAATAYSQGRGGERLRKTDLVRLLSGLTLAPDELATLIRRSCLSFTPTSRDRADFAALGADPAVLREIDGCVRRAAVPRASEPTPSPAAPHRPPLSGVRSGFVLGVGQHAAAGAHPPLPLLFELRDTAGLPVAGHEVALSVTNGWLGAARVVTDSSGRVHVDVTLGPHVGPVAVKAQAEAIERQATLYADPGPAAKLTLRCGEARVEGRMSLAPGGAAVLRVTAQDAFGNDATVTGLQAASGDRGVVRVTFVGADAAGGLVRVAPRDVGSTSLVVVASRQRADVSVTVALAP